MEVYEDLADQLHERAAELRRGSTPGSLCLDTVQTSKESRSVPQEVAAKAQT